jgi:hypothetical protein
VGQVLFILIRLPVLLIRVLLILIRVPTILIRVLQIILIWAYDPDKGLIISELIYTSASAWGSGGGDGGDDLHGRGDIGAFWAASGLSSLISGLNVPLPPMPLQLGQSAPTRSPPAACTTAPAAKVHERHARTHRVASCSRNLLFATLSFAVHGIRLLHEICCMLHVACSMQHISCKLLHVACYTMRWQASWSRRTTSWPPSRLLSFTSCA